MAPSKTRGTSPRQDLTRPVGGRPPELRPADFMLGGREHADTHAGPTMANLKRFTRLDAYQLLIKQAKDRGKRLRPPDISLDDRTSALIKALGLPEHLAEEKGPRHEVSAFTSKCEGFSRACKRNMASFARKHGNWLNEDFRVQFNKYLPQSVHETPSIEPEGLIVAKSTKPEGLVDLSSGDTHIGEASDSDTSSEDDLDSNARSYHTRSSGPATIPKPPTPKPRTSKTYEQLSVKQQRRQRKRLQEVLENEPQSKLIKTFCNTVKVDGEKLSKSAAKDLEKVTHACLEGQNRSSEIATAIKKESRPYTPDEALALCIKLDLSVGSYNKMRQDLISRGFDAFPPYYKIAEAKKRCCDLATESASVSTSVKADENEANKNDNTDQIDFEMDDSSNSSRWNFYLTNEEELFHSSSSSGIASPVSKAPSPEFEAN